LKAILRIVMRTLIRQSINEVQVERRRPPKRYEVDLDRVHDIYTCSTHCYNLRRQRKVAPRLPTSGGSVVAQEDTTVDPAPASPEAAEAAMLDVLAKEVLSTTFLQLHEDAATRSFLALARNPSHLRKAASHLLARVVSRTAANGITGSGGMFVLSPEQFDLIMGQCTSPDPHEVDSTTLPPVPPRRVMGEEGGVDGQVVGGNRWVPLAVRRYLFNRAAASETHLEGVVEVSDLMPLLVDIGAGDGGATSQLASKFAHTWASEASRAMQIRLRGRGYRVVDFPACCLSGDPSLVVGSCGAGDGDHLSADMRALLGGVPVEVLRASPPCVLSCLNVLDRADRPMSLLRALHASLVAVDRFVGSRVGQVGGARKAVCLLALVLPWCPFVEGWSGHKEPTEAMPMSGGRCNQGVPFEAAVFTFVRNVLLPLGFRVVRWARVPYLCEGDNTTEYYALNDAIFVLERSTDP
jgi:hypothetical protein